jgi:hypothetical protein
MKKRWQLQGNQGQSLVELALTLPLLLIMFAGLVEIGAALRDYLVLVNANREGVRFAARGRWFDTDDEVNYIFDRVVAAAGIEQRGDDLVRFLRPLPIGELEPNTTVAVTYIQVPDQVDDVGGLTNEPAEVVGMWYSPTVQIFDTHVTRINANAMAEEARQANYEFNEQYFINDQLLDIPSEDNLVIVETWLEHEQLLKLPIFTELLPERFTLYARSVMRVTLDSRID